MCVSAFQLGNLAAGPSFLVLSTLAAANLAIGWNWGYRTAGVHVTFWLLAVLALLTAQNVVARWFAPATAIERMVAASVVAFALVVGVGLVLGFAGHVALAPYLGAQAALFVGSLLPSRRGFPSRRAAPHATVQGGQSLPAPLSGLSPWTVAVVGLVGALLSFALAFAMGHAPMTLYDSLSYHLFFPARWLQDHALSIIPTPFSDEAQAYAPANGELFFLWLMLPFHGDLLARVGQIPFALLAVVTLYGLARELGAPPEQAVYPPAFFLLSRPVLEQVIGADVDLICATLFLTSLYLGFHALERDRPRDWAIWGISVGLTCGSKYVALIYVPVFLLLAVARGLRVKALWALPGIAAFALPWYVRNWMIAGSPIYPASLTLAGVTIARGAFDRAAMLNSVFHTTDLRLAPVIVAHAFGPTLALVWAPAAAIGAIALASRAWWPHRLIVAVPCVMALLFWFTLPVNTDSRFLMPAIAPALLPLAFAFRSSRTWNRAIHAMYLAAMIWILVGARAAIPAAVPWFMRDWLSLSGLVRPPFLWLCATLALAIGLAWRMGSLRSRWVVPLTAALLTVPTTALALGGERWCGGSPCEYLDVTSPYIRVGLIDGWRWMAGRAHDATIAYTGINLPYPLTGERLTNRVVYANIDGRVRWRFHDYDRAYRAGRFVPLPPLLATGSGELLPAAPGASRPRYERLEGIPAAWIDNLQRLHADYLFISVLSAYEIANVWHNEQGFPIEDAWATADPRVFHLEYESPQVRVFAIERRVNAP